MPEALFWEHYVRSLMADGLPGGGIVHFSCSVIVRASTLSTGLRGLPPTKRYVALVPPTVAIRNAHFHRVGRRPPQSEFDFRASKDSACQRSQTPSILRNGSQATDQVSIDAGRQEWTRDTRHRPPDPNGSPSPRSATPEFLPMRGASACSDPSVRQKKLSPIVGRCLPL